MDFPSALKDLCRLYRLATRREAPGLRIPLVREKPEELFFLFSWGRLLGSLRRGGLGQCEDSILECSMIGSVLVEITILFILPAGFISTSTVWEVFISKLRLIFLVGDHPWLRMRGVTLSGKWDTSVMSVKFAIENRRAVLHRILTRLLVLKAKFNLIANRSSAIHSTFSDHKAKRFAFLLYEFHQTSSLVHSNWTNFGEAVSQIKIALL